MQVETVAWMSELKNTLSLPPLLLALCAWVDYDAHGQRRDYFLALGFFVLALLVKTAVAPLPFVLLLYAWWKRGSVNWADAKGVAPFLFAALVLGWTSVVAGQDYAAQHPQLQETVTHGDFFTRLVIAGLSLWLYVGHALWPFDPLPAYPQWPVDPPTLPELFPWVALLGLLAWLWTERAGWGRHVLLGFGFFLLMLAPFLGFIWISYMDSTWVMDHFLYYPIIGLIGLAVAGLGQLQERLPSAGRWIGAGLLFVGFALLIGESRSYAALFASEEALMAHTVERNPDSWLARNNLGRARMLAGDLSGAIEQCDAALELKPDFVDARTNLGNAYLRGNRLPEAIAEYQQVIEINPTYVEAQSNLGVAYAHSGRLPEAIAQFRQTLQLDPDLALTHFALANALMRTGQVQEAIQHYEEAVRLSPDNPTWQEALDAARREAGGSP
jgi:Flp pilus assembly protein TadD